MPNLAGMDESTANQTLSNLGLVGKAGDTVFSSTVAEGKVATQDQAANSTAKAGDTITYHLSKGVETVSVPSVVGMSESAATAALQKAGFSVVTNSAASDTYESGLVSYQSVTGSAAKGSQVVITISTGSNNASLPDVTGLDESTASTRLSNAGFGVTVRYDYSGSGTAGTVVWQSPDAGSVKKGTNVTIGVAASQPTNTTNTTGAGNANTNSTANATGGDSGASEGTGGSSTGDTTALQ